MKCPHCNGTGETPDSELLFGKNSDLPDWLLPEVWNAYLEMRKKIKKPLTEYGKKLALRELESLLHQHQSPTAVLEQSILWCHQGLFPVKNGNGHHVSNTLSMLETERQREEEYKRKPPKPIRTSIY